MLVVALLLTACAGLVVLSGVVRATRDAARAADLGALTAAQLLLDRGDQARPGPCDRDTLAIAAAVVAANHARLDRCEVADAGVVSVSVSAPVPGPISRLGPARAVATAGPETD